VSTISAEEARALAGDEGTERRALRPKVPAEVVRRDFAAPRRLSSARLAALRGALGSVVAAEGRRLSARLRVPIELALEELAETEAARAVAALEPPGCALSPADPGRHGGALLWERAAAGAAVELALGGELRLNPRSEPLSPIEVALLVEILRPLCRAIAGACETSFEPGALRQHEEELAVLREEAELGDPQRLAVALSLEGLGERSTLRLLLAGVSRDARDESEPPATLPPHVERIEVELSARLGSLELPLAEVLGLEVGDVLALDLPVGAPLAICLEDEPCLSADWGTHERRLALRVRGPADESKPA
jgi:flagellar motor switch protein FliM